jgi:hypothetical protein
LRRFREEIFGDIFWDFSGRPYDIYGMGRAVVSSVGNGRPERFIWAIKGLAKQTLEANNQPKKLLRPHAKGRDGTGVSVARHRRRLPLLQALKGSMLNSEGEIEAVLSLERIAWRNLFPCWRATEAEKSAKARDKSN